MNMGSDYNTISTSPSSFTQKLPDNQENLPLSNSLSDNLNRLHSIFSNCTDIVYREFDIDTLRCSAALIFISGLVDAKLINESIITSLMNIKEVPSEIIASGHVIEVAKKHFLQIANINEILTIGEVVDALLNGNTVFLLDGDIKALKMATQGWKNRNIEEPNIERMIRGPKEGFTEDIYTNISMLRLKIKSSQLKAEEHIVGRQTRTKIYITYLQGIADDNILKDVRERIVRIDVDSILEGGYLEELIEDTSFTIFPQIQHSERPDRVAGAILEGRVAIIIDGTPLVLIVPATMIEFFQSPADYYERYPVASAIRLLRLLSFIISLLLPSLFVAIISYHKEMIPTPLFISIIGAAHGVPFPIYIEALIMEVSFEILREAGIRLPGVAGQTIGIVGVLVIGEASVKAGVVSPITVIIIALTAIASFGIPSYDMGYAVRILRFFMMFLGAALGLYGIMLGLLILLIHITSLKSFGVNYLSPLAPLNFKELKDVFVRFPWWTMDERPSFSNANNRHRQKHFLKTNSPAKDNKDEK